MSVSRGELDVRHAVLVAVILLASAGCGRTPEWEPLPLGTRADFRAIFFTDPLNGWIAGGGYDITGGLVGHTSDGGKTWRYVSDLTPRERTSASSIYFFDSSRGLVATSSGAILRTTDGGESWAPVIPRGRVSSLSSLFVLDDRREIGWAAGSGDVVRTDDGGETWRSLTPGGVDISYRPPIRKMQFLDDRRGWAAGMQASLARTMDGGATWQPAATPIVGPNRPNFWDVSFLDAELGWVVGEEGSMLSTADGGITWTRRSTGLRDAQSAPKLERIPTAKGPVEVDAGDRTPGFTITAVRFVDRSRGWVAGFYANLGRSLILHTQDAGATWRVEGDIAGEELHALFVQGAEWLWAVGARVREGPQAIYRRSLTTK